MARLKITSVILMLLAAVPAFLSCNRKQTEETEVGSQPDSVQTVNPAQAAQKVMIDSLFSNNMDKVLVYAIINKDQSAIEIRNAEFPDPIVSSINILKDAEGRVICVTEFPYSESGDWFVSQRHYFGPDGKTFAFEQQASQFNSMCTEGAALETSTGYYDRDFRRTSVGYSLVDEQGNPLPPAACDLYKFEYTVYPDVETLLEAKKLAIAP